MAIEFVTQSLAPGDRRFKSIFFSVALHAGAIILVIAISKLYYHSEEFKRPPTFTLVDFPPPKPVSPASEPREIKRAVARQSTPSAATQAEQPKQPEAPDITDKNPVPSARQEPSAPASETGGANGPVTGADQPLTIGSATELDNTTFVPIFNPKPLYPAIAIKANIQGHVDLELVVTPVGTVESFAIIKVEGHPSFGDETAKVIRRWRFPPPRINGKPVKIRYDYRVNFSLN